MYLIYLGIDRVMGTHLGVLPLWVYWGITTMWVHLIPSYVLRIPAYSIGAA